LRAVSCAYSTRVECIPKNQSQFVIASRRRSNLCFEIAAVAAHPCNDPTDFFGIYPTRFEPFHTFIFSLYSYSMKTAIGIDIGGTKISVTLGTALGKIIAQREFSTPLRLEASKAIPQISLIVFDFLKMAQQKKMQVSGIGIGLPGAVNTRLGKIPKSPNLPGWENLPLKEKLSQAFHMPIFLANDANAAACAEHVFGTAKRVSDFVYLTVSTGIGGGIFVNGKLLEGAGFAAGEIGHVPVVTEGNLCGCGKKGCLEAHASGTAIAKTYTWLSGKPVSGAKEVVQRFNRGDRKAIKAFEGAAYHLGTGLSMIMNILNPEMIVLGGGVFKSAPALFLKQALERCRQTAWPEAFKTCQVKKSILKGEAGDLGALSLVFLNAKK